MLITKAKIMKHTCSMCFKDFNHLPIKNHKIKYQEFCSYECFKQYKEGSK